MAGRPQIDWNEAYAYWLSLDPWYPGQLGRWGYSRSNLSRALAPPQLRRSYANVARHFGISRQAVWRYARDHDWPAQAGEFDRAVRRHLYGEPTTIRDVVAGLVREMRSKAPQQHP
jgi:hypothetical protein